MTRITILAAAAAFALIGVSAGHAQMKHDGMQHGGGEAAAGPSKAYMDAMSKMDAEMKAMTMTGKPGVDFAMMMIPHHQSAIDMAQAYLAGDEKNPELVKLSNEIIAAQEREIAFLKDWLAKNQ